MYPPIRAELMPRPRLVGRLHAGLDRRLTLVSAPAGFGKTTLLSECVTHCEWDVVWLSLDEGDNDPAQFLRYLIAALRQLDLAIGQGAQSLLHSPQLPSGQGLAIQLLNDISVLPPPIPPGPGRLPGHPPD